MSETTEVDIVCVSPRSGSLVLTRVTLPRNTPGISDVEEGNSETSRRLEKYMQRFSHNKRQMAKTIKQLKKKRAEREVRGSKKDDTEVQRESDKTRRERE